MDDGASHGNGSKCRDPAEDQGAGKKDNHHQLLRSARLPKYRAKVAELGRIIAGRQ
jgi:hypothetical protein